MHALTNLMTPLLAEGEATLANDRVIRTVLEYAVTHLRELDVYRHQNDFVKITLAVDDHIQLRVHIWDRITPSAEGNIHSHRHPILSRVVTGEFEEQRWLADDSGSPFRRYDFAPNIPGQLELVENGLIRLRATPTNTRTVGDVYSIPLHEFHDVLPLKIPTVTVFTQDLRSRADGLVASESPVKQLARPTLMHSRQLDGIHDILSTQLKSLAGLMGEEGLLHEVIPLVTMRPRG